MIKIYTGGCDGKTLNSRLAWVTCVTMFQNKMKREKKRREGGREGGREEERERKRETDGESK